MAAAEHKKEQARAWCFTINNPSPAECTIFPDGLPEGVRYIVYQRERGAEGTEHIQGYLQFVKPRLLTWVKKLTYNDTLPFARAHLAVARGSPEQNKAYCTKDDTRVDGPWELGAPSKSGERTDLHAVFDRLQKDGDLRAVPGDVMLKYGSNVLKVSALFPAPRRDGLQVITLIGETGIGKSFQCHQRWPDLYTPYYGNSGLWWDGYIDQDTVMLEEFRGQIQLQKLLQILDPYPLHLEVKGGCVAARYRRIIITSNCTPENWYKNEDGARDSEFRALYRRLGCLVGAFEPRYIVTNTREDLIGRLDHLLAPAPAPAPAPDPVQVPPKHSTPFIIMDDDVPLGPPPPLRRCNADLL